MLGVIILVAILGTFIALIYRDVKNKNIRQRPSVSEKEDEEQVPPVQEPPIQHLGEED